MAAYWSRTNNNIVINFIETYYGDGKDEAKQIFQNDINNLDRLLILLDQFQLHIHQRQNHKLMSR